MTCSVTMDISLAEGAVQETVLEDIRSRFEVYFEELRKSWAESEYLTVRISYLEARVLDADGVVDISDCMVNGNGGNTVLKADEIPVLGEIGVTA